MKRISTRTLYVLAASPLGVAILDAIFGDSSSWSQGRWILLFGLAFLLTALIVILGVISRRRAASPATGQP